MDLILSNSSLSGSISIPFALLPKHEGVTREIDEEYHRRRFPYVSKSAARMA